MATPTKLEFAVQMTCQACVDAVSKVIKEKPGIELKDVQLDTGQVVVESTLPSEEVKSVIESTGRLAVLLGMGGSEESQWGAAVAAMSIGSQAVKGVVRMAQVSKDKCIFEGTVDGLPPGRHALCVHEKGDVSEGCASCGEVLGAGLTDKAQGLLSELDVGSDGRAMFRFDNDKLKVWDLIGRSVIIHQGSQPSTDTRLVCGIIARSSGLFQNSKRLCTCDGVSIWEERNRPLVGEGRSSYSQL
ncbi:copper chaperone for superoxide dismutase-like [Babylonia areolata]|uniref:copper chaperone for superoxide dismutase-like n=1 Tax=Babylonia areolata TaxID=304850 RepID=UPI003FD3D54B